MARIVVVLPAPLGPRKPTTCPAGTTNERSSRARTVPYVRRSPSNSSDAPVVVRAISPPFLSWNGIVSHEKYRKVAFAARRPTGLDAADRSSVAVRRRGRGHELPEPGGTAAGRRQSGGDGEKLTDRTVRLSGGSKRVHELAGRATRLEGDLRPVQPVPPHDRPLHRGPRCHQIALRPRSEHLQELRPQQSQAVRDLQRRRLRDRGRDPLLPGRQQGLPRGPPFCSQLGPIPRRDRRV